MDKRCAGLSARQRGALALTAAGTPIFRLCCALSWPWVLTGGLAAAATLTLLSALPRRGGARGAVLLLPALLLGALAAAWESSFAFPETAGKPLAAGLVLALSLAAAVGGAERAGRCAGILLRVTAALYGTVLVFSLPQLRAERLLPAGRPSDALRVWAALLPPGAALLLPPDREAEAPLRWPWPAAAGTALAASLVTGGILSPALAAGPEPFRTLARGVSVLGVVRRFEALVNAAMLMSGFCLCTLLLTAADALCGGRLLRQNAGEALMKNFFEKTQKKC